MTSTDGLTFTTIHSLTFERADNKQTLPTLPTRHWACLGLNGQGHILRLTLQHGDILPRLEVRVLNKGWLSAEHAEFDKSLRWLLDDLDKDAPLLGLDAEGGQRSISLVQLATARRCLLVRMPPAEQQATRGTTFSPAFRRLMMDRNILKGGAELWNDVLDIWRACNRLATNGCVNVTLLHTDAEGNSDSLEEMCNRVIGRDSFRKDRPTTCSTWDAETLTLRQLVYAAVDAQASYKLVAKAPVLPDLLHVQDLPRKWLDRASHWHFLRRLEEKEQEKELEVAFESVVFGADQIVVQMKQYTTRIRKQSNVTIYWFDGASSQMTVRQVSGKRATLVFTGGGDAQSRLRRQEHLKLIQLNRTDEHDIFSRPQQKYLAAFMHGTEPPSPFNSTLLCLPFPHLSSCADGPSWWWDTTMRSAIPSEAEQHPSFAALNESQQSALRLTDAQRITIIQGPPGSGKTRTIAAEVVRSLQRTSSTSRAADRVLCLAETNTAARHLCEAIARFLPPNQLQLLVSNEFEYEWHAELYDDLVKRGYMEQLRHMRFGRGQERWQADTKQNKLREDPAVLVSTIGKCIGASDSGEYQHRATLIVDEASQVHDLKAILALRILPHTERLLLFGDDKQLAPYVAREEAASILDLANEAIDARSSSRRRPFSVARTMLNLQYRMPPTLGGMISTIFYDGLLRSHKTKEAESCVRWMHVNGPSERDGTSCFNRSEMAQVVSLWKRLQRLPYDYAADDIVVICFYEAQRKHLAADHPSLRAHNVDSFQGQEAPVILLTMSASYMSAFLKDRRRVNVACSRAMERLFIIGQRELASRGRDNCWWEISKFCRSAESKRLQPPPLLANPRHECARQQPPASGHLSPQLLRETLCKLLSEADGPMSLTNLGWGFVKHHFRPFRECSLISLEPFLRQHADVFIVYPHPQTAVLFVQNRPVPPPARPCSDSATRIEDEMLALLRATEGAGMALIKLGSSMGTRHAGIDFKALAGCTMKRFIERRPNLFALTAADNHLDTWVTLKEDTALQYALCP